MVRFVHRRGDITSVYVELRLLPSVLFCATSSVCCADGSAESLRSITSELGKHRLTGRCLQPIVSVIPLFIG